MKARGFHVIVLDVAYMIVRHLLLYVSGCVVEAPAVCGMLT